MSLINVNNLTFAYEGSYDNIFENVSFQIDTDWKLGFFGRNGRGKTTFLRLLMGELEHKGEISASVEFDYFPPDVKNTGDSTLQIVKNLIAPFDSLEEELELISANPERIEDYGELLEKFMSLDGYIIDELIEKELRQLDCSPEILKRPFETLSNGERTKILLCGLFLKKSNFLLIDEPTNHLDYEGRQAIARYLSGKKGFILVSHDRRFLDEIIDHVLVINKMDIQVQKGNYSSWQENKSKQDAFEIAENEKLKRDIKHLNAASKRTSDWSDEVEKSKIGTHAGDRGYIGHKSAKMMKRSKAIEKRRNDAAEEKTKLLKNIDSAEELKLVFPAHHSKVLIHAKDLSLFYGETSVIENASFALEKGDRLAIRGVNGSGKTTIIKAILGQDLRKEGQLRVAPGLKISYVNQDTSHLQGSLKDFIAENDVSESLFFAILRKMGFERVQFEKNMENFSAGQKKKAIIAKSLCQQAHIYIWDEPLNFIDIISRIQIEELIIKYSPTMIFVEHDRAFCENVATKILEI